MKRFADILSSSLLLVALGVPMLVVALAIRCREGAPILFRQQRMGRHGQPFTILKFRTMRTPRPGDAEVSSGDADQRITRIGQTLRRHRMDEWPQLWNVLRGDMSMVGPRPEVPRFVDIQNAQWKVVLQVRPGITGPDALAFKDEGDLLSRSDDPESTYREDILPAKLKMQEDYARNRTLMGDFVLLFRTLGALRG